MTCAQRRNLTDIALLDQNNDDDASEDTAEELEDPEERDRRSQNAGEDDQYSGDSDDVGEYEENDGSDGGNGDIATGSDGGNTSGDEDDDGDTDSEQPSANDTSAGEGDLNENEDSLEQDFPFATQNPGKVRRILRNLLSHLPSDRIKAFREANKAIYLDICLMLAIETDAEMSKTELHDAVLFKV